MKKLTEKEWVEAFEEINGRKPSPEEFMEGMRSGEFVITDQQQLSSEKRALSSTSDLYRNILKQLHSYRHILYIVLSFLGLVILFVFLQSNRISFDESNFEDGTWVVMRKEKTDDINVVQYMSGTWDEMIVNSENSDDWFEYESLEEFYELQELEEKPVKLPKVGRIKQEVEHTTGLENINTNHFMVISKGDVHLIFYWLNKDRAAVYFPGEQEVYVAQKMNTDSNIFGEYKLIDNTVFDEDTDRQRERKSIFDFNNYIQTSSTEKVGFGVLSLQQFLEVYQLAGGDIEELKDLDEINRTIKPLGKKINDFNDIELILFDSSIDNDGFDSSQAQMAGIAWVSFLAMPVEGEQNLVMTTSVSTETLENALEDSGFKGSIFTDKEDVLKISKMAALLEMRE